MARRTGQPLAALVLSNEERSLPEAQVRRHRVARSMSDRRRMILGCADGLGNKVAAAEIGVYGHTAGKWRRCFVKDRIEGLSDEPRPKRPRTIKDEKVAEVIERTLTQRPVDAPHWPLRSMAKEAGLSRPSIRRARGAFGLPPHRAETFKLSSDPHFVEKVRGLGGLYMSPPARALVPCVDEKSRLQALDRTQPVLPDQRRHLDQAGPATAKHKASVRAKAEHPSLSVKRHFGHAEVRRRGWRRTPGASRCCRGF